MDIEKLCDKLFEEDVTTEEFVTNVTFMLGWVIDTVENFPNGVVKTA